MTGPDEPRPSGRRIAPRTMATLVMLAVFAAGVAAGVAFDHGVLHRPPQGAQLTGRGFAPEFVPGAPIRRPTGVRRGRPPAIDRFARDLDLTPAQTATVDSLLARDFAAVTAARELMQPHVDSIIAATRAGIDSVLTPAQRVKYQAMIAAQVRRAEAMARDRRGPGGGPGGGPGTGPR